MLEFTWDRETKNTVRFAEVEREGKPPVIGILYVKKFAAGDLETLTVDIRELKE